MPSATPGKSKKPKKPHTTQSKAAVMPTAKTAAKPAAKPAARHGPQNVKVEKPGKPAISVKASSPNAPVSKKPLKSAKPDTSLKKVPAVPTKSSPESKPVAAVADVPVKKKPGRPPKNPAAADSAPASTGAKRGRKPKNAGAAKVGEDLDLSDIEDDLVGEPVAETTEKVKPLRMKISKAKERALMKEFGLDETVLSEIGRAHV